MTKRQLFNAKNGGKKIEKDMVLEVVSVGQFPDVDKDGNEVTVTALECKNGEIYTTISATIGDSIGLLEEILNDESCVKISVNESVSNNGRKFYQLQLV